MSVTPAPTFNIVESWCWCVFWNPRDSKAVCCELSKNLLLKLFLDGGGEVTPKIIITKAIVGPD
jgi:hypothetical protein